MYHTSLLFDKIRQRSNMKETNETYSLSTELEESSGYKPSRDSGNGRSSTESSVRN